MEPRNLCYFSKSFQKNKIKIKIKIKYKNIRQKYSFVRKNSKNVAFDLLFVLFSSPQQHTHLPHVTQNTIQHTQSHRRGCEPRNLVTEPQNRGCEPQNLVSEPQNPDSEPQNVVFRATKRGVPSHVFYFDFFFFLHVNIICKIRMSLFTFGGISPGSGSGNLNLVFSFIYKKGG